MNPSISIRLPRIAIPPEDLRRAASGSPAVVMPEISDECLMLQVREGSSEALGALFRRYARLVRGICFRVLRDASEADDLVQEVFLLVHRDCARFDSGKGPARSWILQMAYRRAISRRR